MTNLCPEDDLAPLLEAMGNEDETAVERVDELLGIYPGDARLHFLRGSLMVGRGDHIEAHHALSRAVELEPDFLIARFQLGFFQLTSGEASSALETWGRLDALPDGHYLRAFVDGLRCLIRDEFDSARDHLQRGIEANSENLPLNRDMQLLVDQCEILLAPEVGEEGADAMEFSETSILLAQQARKPVKH